MPGPLGDFVALRCVRTAECCCCWSGPGWLPCRVHPMTTAGWAWGWRVIVRAHAPHRSIISFVAFKRSGTSTHFDPMRFDYYRLIDFGVHICIGHICHCSPCVLRPISQLQLKAASESDALDWLFVVTHSWFVIYGAFSLCSWRNSDYYLWVARVVVRTWPPNRQY